MDAKKCFKCLTEKPLTQFYKHSQMADGYLNKCKECAKVDVRHNRESRRAYYREFDNNRNGLPERIQARTAFTKKWRSMYPERWKAQWILNNAVNRGHLSKGFLCEVCGSTTRVEAHHADYGAALEVKWLCKEHHYQADVERRKTEAE